MDDFELLRALFKTDALASVQDDRIILEERSKQPYTLKITGAPYDTIAFKADMFPDPGSIFRNGNHECRRADYVIVSRRGNSKWIVYVEMKRRRGNPREVEDQLRGAKCVVAYCREIGQQFWNPQLGRRRFLERYAERFVSVRGIGINERPIRSRPRVVHDSPARTLWLSAPKGVLQFNKLLGAAAG